MNGDRYILDADFNPVPCDDLMVWAYWIETAERHLAHDRQEGATGEPITISTVFLGLDHGRAEQGPPILWETLVFGGPLDGEGGRYTSKEDAWAGHQAMCQRVTQALAPESL
jgi:hypothetical protein